jgi:zeaxanthin glucosyltransferase
MKRDRVILLIYHGQGHFNACIKIARILSKKYEVTFAGHHYFERYIQQMGFQFFALSTVPFGLNFENWVNTQEKKQNIWWHSLKDRWTNRLFFLRRDSLQKMIEAVKPSFILIDSWQSTDFIALYPELKARQIKVGFLQTMLSTVIDETPPLISDVLPDSGEEVTLALRKINRDGLKRKLFQKIKYFGRDNEAIIADAIKQNKLHQKYLSDHKSIFSNIFNLPEFILAPAEFEFKNRKPLPNQSFVGSMIEIDRAEQNIEAVDYILTEIAQKNTSLIYCTFGSTDLEESAIVKEFISKLNQVLERRQYRCIVSSGSKNITNFVKANYQDIHVFAHVPQIKVLKHAKLFINHGGLNSIKEAIATETPMLVYPVKDNTDNHGNGSRVVYHQLGLRGNMIKDSTKEIEDKIETLLTNSMFKTNIQKFNAQIKSKYTDQNFLSLFEQIKTVE